jgi:hypothetical protein
MLIDALKSFLADHQLHVCLDYLRGHVQK